MIAVSEAAVAIVTSIIIAGVIVLLRGVEICGTAGFASVVAAARAAFTELHVEAADLIAEGDRAAARIRWRGTRPDGGVVDRETIDVIRVAGGLAVEHWGAQVSATERSS